MTRLVGAMIVAMGLVACSAAPSQTPGPTATPADPFFEPQGGDAAGPVVELGAGDAFEADWRYGMYPTGDGWCLQLDLDGSVEARCDAILPETEADAAFGDVGVTTSETTGVTVVEGIVTEQAATVWVIAADQRRAPAVLIPLEDWEVDGQAFLGSAPADLQLTHVMAVAFNGQVLQTLELP